jgi:hypothetical protein
MNELQDPPKVPDDFKVAMRVVRGEHPRDLTVYVGISFLVPTCVRIDIEDVTHEHQALDANVLVLKFTLVPIPSARQQYRFSEEFTVDGTGYEFVVLTCVRDGVLHVAAVDDEKRWKKR